MKLMEMIKRVDRSEKNTDPANIDHFTRELGIEHYFGWDNTFADRVKEHFLIKWICTDSWVGLRAYYMDDEPVAVSMQKGRKSDPEFEFVSKEAAEKVRAFILTLLPGCADNYSVLDPEEDIDEFYTVTYAAEILVSEGFVDGRPCKIVDKHTGGNFYGSTSQVVTVEFEDGTTKKVPTSEFKIRCHFN